MIQIDEVGLLYEAPLLSPDGSIAVQPAALEGWYINTTHAVPGWDDLRIAATTPHRVFGGNETLFYRFADRDAFDAAMAVADLSLPALTPPPPPLPAVVPASVTRRQGRLALLQAGKLDTAEAAIAAIADPAQKRAAQIEYEADTWERSNAFLVALWLGMDGTLPELDALFVTAETL